MYRSALSSRLSRGRSTPAIRAIPSSLLALPLLMPWVGADDHHDAPAPDHPTPIAHLLHGRPDLHLRTSSSLVLFFGYLNLYTTRPRVRSYGESSTFTRSPGRIRM